MSKEYEMRPLEKLVTDDKGFLVKKEVMFIEADAVDDLKLYYEIKHRAVLRIADEMSDSLGNWEYLTEGAIIDRLSGVVSKAQENIRKILEA